MKKGFDCEQVFDEKSLKSKIKSCRDKIKTKLHGNQSFAKENKIC